MVDYPWWKFLWTFVGEIEYTKIDKKMFEKTNCVKRKLVTMVIFQGGLLFKLLKHFNYFLRLYNSIHWNYLHVQYMSVNIFIDNHVDIFWQSL